MQRTRMPRTNRPAFTLIELLIVIGIIALLVALTTAGVMKTFGRAKQAEAAQDITKLQSGLRTAMDQYKTQSPLPSKLVLYNDLSKYSSATASTLDRRSADALRKMFGQRFLQTLDPSKNPLGGQIWDPKNVPMGRKGWTGWDNSSVLSNSFLLEGQQCLVFYVGGVVVNGACIGFSTDPLLPMNPNSTDRIGPFFDFKKGRLVPANSPPNSKSYGPNAFCVYLDSHHDPADPLAQPYAYFSSTTLPNTYNPNYLPPPAAQVSDCNALGIWPYFDTTAKQYLNPNGFQIISAGADGLFGVGGGPPGAGTPGSFASSAYDPKIGASDLATRDNQANFSQSVLGTNQN